MSAQNTRPGAPSSAAAPITLLPARAERQPRRTPKQSTCFLPLMSSRTENCLEQRAQPFPWPCTRSKRSGPYKHPGPWQPCESSLSPPLHRPPARPRLATKTEAGVQRERPWSLPDVQPALLQAFWRCAGDRKALFKGLGGEGGVLPPSFLCSTLTIFGHTLYVFTFFSLHFARMQMLRLFLYIYLCMHIWGYFLLSALRYHLHHYKYNKYYY